MSLWLSLWKEESSGSSSAGPAGSDGQSQSQDHGDSVVVEDSETEGEDRASNARELALRRKLQTAPARAAKAVKLAVEAVTKHTVPEMDYASRLQKQYFSASFHPHRYQKPGYADDQSDLKQQTARERARCVWSFLVGLKGTVLDLFQKRGTPEHTLNVVIADDTSTKLKAAGSGRHVVYTVMNTVQAAVVRFVDGSWVCLHIPTPIRILQTSKADSIHRAFTSWLLVTSSGLGAIWERLQCPRDLCNGSAFQTLVFMGDALKANEAAWKTERAKRAQVGGRSLGGLRLKCCNHQLSLIRKPAVLSIPNFWTTIVRLGHLMETQSFRRSFAAALVALLQQEGQFVRSLVLA